MFQLSGFYYRRDRLGGAETFSGESSACPVYVQFADKSDKSIKRLQGARTLSVAETRVSLNLFLAAKTHAEPTSGTECQSTLGWGMRLRISLAGKFSPRGCVQSSHLEMLRCIQTATPQGQAPRLLRCSGCSHAERTPTAGTRKAGRLWRPSFLHVEIISIGSLIIGIGLGGT